MSYNFYSKRAFVKPKSLRVDFDSLETIGVGVQTQIMFKVWKAELMIVIIWNFAGQNNAYQKLLKFLIPFDGNWKSMLKLSQKHHFCEFKQKNAPKDSWSAFFIFSRFGVFFQDQTVLMTLHFAWRHHLTQKATCFHYYI